MQLGIYLAVWLLGATMPRGMRIEPQVIRIARSLPEVLFAHTQSDPTLRELLDFHFPLQDSWRARFRLVAYLWYASTASVAQGATRRGRDNISREARWAFYGLRAEPSCVGWDETETRPQSCCEAGRPMSSAAVCRVGW